MHAQSRPRAERRILQAAREESRKEETKGQPMTPDPSLLSDAETILSSPAEDSFEAWAAARRLAEWVKAQQSEVIRVLPPAPGIDCE